MAQAAERALIDRPFMTATDVLVGIGWLTTSQVDGWRQGRVDYLERQVTTNPSKISIAMAAFRHWARQEGLNPIATYQSRSRNHRPLVGSRAHDLVVISSLKEWICTECTDTVDLLLMEGDGPLCLVCADLYRLDITEKCSRSLRPATTWIQ